MYSNPTSTIKIKKNKNKNAKSNIQNPFNIFIFPLKLMASRINLVGEIRNVYPRQ